MAENSRELLLLLPVPREPWFPGGHLLTCFMLCWELNPGSVYASQVFYEPNYNPSYYVEFPFLSSSS